MRMHYVSEKNIVGHHRSSQSALTCSLTTFLVWATGHEADTVNSSVCTFHLLPESVLSKESRAPNLVGRQLAGNRTCVKGHHGV